MNQFEQGDVVRLKSGSPEMTVDSDRADEVVRAVWFDGAKYCEAFFNHACLIKVEKESA